MHLTLAEGDAMPVRRMRVRLTHKPQLQKTPGDPGDRSGLRLKRSARWLAGNEAAHGVQSLAQRRAQRDPLRLGDHLHRSQA